MALAHGDALKHPVLARLPAAGEGFDTVVVLRDVLEALRELAGDAALRQAEGKSLAEAQAALDKRITALEEARNGQVINGVDAGQEQSVGDPGDPADGSDRGAGGVRVRRSGHSATRGG